MSNNLEEHKKKILSIVKETIKETFLSYFNLTCEEIEQLRSQEPDAEKITCETKIQNTTSECIVSVTIEENILEKISQIIYPPDQAKTQEAYESCVLEIANIVGMRVKTYLNECGFDLTASIPKVSNTFKSEYDDIYISFNIEEKHLHVDIKLNLLDAVAV